MVSCRSQEVAAAYKYSLFWEGAYTETVASFASLEYGNYNYRV